MTGLKICGLQPGDDVAFAGHPVVTHAGIVFAPKSRRYVDPEAATALSRQLADRVAVMGVFVDASLAEVLQVAKTALLTGVQLHGQETPETCEALRRHGYIVWKALSVPADDAKFAAFRDRISQFSGVVDALLLDAPAPKDASDGVTGGFGRSFAWSTLSELLPHDRDKLPQIWIAGGLNPTNVAQLLTVFPAAGVDVSSGVEVDGRKSTVKIQAMIEAVNRYA